MQVKDLVVALRPWSFPLSILPICVTSAVLHRRFPSDVPLLSYEFVASLIIGLSIHAGANLTNTFYDFKRGVDKKETASDRTLVDGNLPPWMIKWMSMVFYALAFFGAMACMVFFTHERVWLAILFITGAVLGYFYTGGPKGFKYVALGDVVIFLAFGPVIMQGASVIMKGELDIVVLFYSLPFGLLSESILHANNTRDIETDRRGGGKTLAIWLGLDQSFKLYVLLLGLAYTNLLMLALLHAWGLFIVVGTFPMAKKLTDQFLNNTLQTLPEQTAQLATLLGILTYLGVCLT